MVLAQRLCPWQHTVQRALGMRDPSPWSAHKTDTSSCFCWALTGHQAARSALYSTCDAGVVPVPVPQRRKLRPRMAASGHRQPGGCRHSLFRSQPAGDAGQGMSPQSSPRRGTGGTCPRGRWAQPQCEGGESFCKVLPGLPVVRAQPGSHCSSIVHSPQSKSTSRRASSACGRW